MSERRSDGVPCAPGLQLCRPVEGAASRARGATRDALGGSRRAALRPRPRGDLCWSRRRRDDVSVAHRRAKVPAGPWSCHPDRPGGASRARGTCGEALGVGRAAASTPRSRGDVSLSGRRRGGAAASPSPSPRPDGGGAASPSCRGALTTPPAPPEAAPSTAARPGLVGCAGRPSESAERRRRLRAPGGTSPHPGDGGAASPSAPSALTTPPAPPETTPSTAPPPGTVGRVGRPSESAERRRRLRGPGATSPRPGGGGAASPSSRGALATPPAPPEAAPSTAPRPGPVGREGRPSEAQERRRRLRCSGATSRRPGGDGAASSSSRGAMATPPAPPEAAPSTAPRPGPVGREGRRSEPQERRRRL